MTFLERSSFVEEIQGAIRQIDPALHISLAGDFALIVNGLRLNLEDPWRLAQEEPEKRVTAVQNFLLEWVERATDIPADFASAQPLILPRIHPSSIFRHMNRSAIAHVPWVNDTVILFVLDFPRTTVSISMAMLELWETSLEEVEETARSNLKHLDQGTFHGLIEGNEGEKALLMPYKDGYATSRILDQDFRSTLQKIFGNEFFAAMPARDLLIAFSRSPKPFIERIQAMVDAAYETMPYPISSELILVTMDGVTGTKEQSTEQDETSSKELL